MWYTIKTKEYREKHEPVTGALYRARRSSSPRGKLKMCEGDIVMVVSKLHRLVDDVRKASSGVITTSYMWDDLHVLYRDKIHDFTGFKDSAWYEWFERAS